MRSVFIMNLPELGSKLRVVNDKPLTGNEIAPPLKVGEEYPLKEIIFDSAGNPHYDVGLVSKYNYISSFETSEELERGTKIHWCHPSRFEVI